MYEIGSQVLYANMYIQGKYPAIDWTYVLLDFVLIAAYEIIGCQPVYHCHSLRMLGTGVIAVA